jgi:hypothetical protein
VEHGHSLHLEHPVVAAQVVVPLLAQAVVPVQELVQELVQGLVQGLVQEPQQVEPQQVEPQQQGPQQQGPQQQPD